MAGCWPRPHRPWPEPVPEPLGVSAFSLFRPGFIRVPDRLRTPTQPPVRQFSAVFTGPSPALLWTRLGDIRVFRPPQLIALSIEGRLAREPMRRSLRPDAGRGIPGGAFSRQPAAIRLAGNAADVRRRWADERNGGTRANLLRT